MSLSSRPTPSVLVGIFTLAGCTGDIVGPDEGSVLALSSEAVVVGLGGNQLGLWPRVPAMAHDPRLKPIAALDEGTQVTIETAAQVGSCVISQRGYCAVSFTDASGRSIHGVVQSKYLAPASQTPPAPSTEFYLPWAAGVDYPVTLGHNSASHADGLDNWAWDFGLPMDTPVLAAHDGRVRLVKRDGFVGGGANDANYVVLERLDASGNPDGIETAYLHLDRPEVAVGAIVRRGDELGLSGMTGWATGPHLHFQVQRGPDRGGTTSYWNPTIHAAFHEDPHDPAYGDSPASQN